MTSAEKSLRARHGMPAPRPWYSGACEQTAVTTKPAGRTTVKRRAALALAVLGLALAARSSRHGAYGALQGWSAERPRISAEVRRSALPGAGAFEPSFVRSIEVTRPRAIELTVEVPPPGQLPREQQDPPPACDAPPRALLRAGCPGAPPEVGPCPTEGQECRYPMADSCTAEYECLFGLWSPVGVVCPDGEPGRLLSGSGQCEASTPVADAPCADEGVSCGHQPCGIGDFTRVIAECRCGRWYQRPQQCPLTR